MSRYALEVQYDGSKFNGWQSQSSGRTVQDEIEKSLEVLTGERRRIIASGRTDAGVHALGQVAHFDLEKDFDLKRMVKGLNGINERELSIKNAYKVDDDFHARFSAFSREYVYLIYNDATPSPFVGSRALWVNKELDISYLNEVASSLEGTHDFASFCKKTSSQDGTIRTLESVTFSRQEKLICCTIRGNAFLHNMIRIIMGTLLEMHEEKLPAAHLEYVLEMKNRDYAGKTAAPCGLYLKKIFYNPELSQYMSAF